MAGLTNFDNVVDMDFLHLRILTMIKLLKWQSHGSVYVNVIRKSNNSANNSSNGIPTKYRFVVCQPTTHPGKFPAYSLDPYMCCIMIKMDCIEALVEVFIASS